MHRTEIGIITAFFMITFLLVSPAAASAISVQPVDQGTNTTNFSFRILLDDAQNGVAGYRMNIAAGGPEGSRIISVDFPEWAVLHDTGILPAVNTSLKAVDLREAIQPGARDILLATVTLTGWGGSAPELQIRSVQVEDDNSGVSTPDYPGIAYPGIAKETSSAGSSAGVSAGSPPLTDTMAAKATSTSATSSSGGQTAAITPVASSTPYGSQVASTPALTAPAGTTAGSLQTTPPATSSAGAQSPTVPVTRAPLPAVLALAAAGVAAGAVVISRKE